MLWEHAPVTEDCSTCHAPHGSTNPGMVKLRGPLLCQSCHSQQGHPSFAYGPSALPGKATPATALALGSCMNCHTPSARLESSLGLVADSVNAMEQRSRKLSLAAAAVLLGPARRGARPTAPDPATWTCSKCPFDKGYVSEAQLGAGYVDDSSARFGDYTGLDEDGAVVVAGAEGGVALESGYRLDYRFITSDLMSRSLAIEGGKQGSL